jgi:hypothetical protein
MRTKNDVLFSIVLIGLGVISQAANAALPTDGKAQRRCMGKTYLCILI